jgi:hypothetical protein
MKQEYEINSITDLVKYEICSSWFAWLFSGEKMQDRIAKYYVNLTKKKLKNYQRHIDFVKNKSLDA